MLFTPDAITLIEQGIKTQTRRPCKEGEFAGTMLQAGKYALTVVGGTPSQIMYRVGRTYALCPGRGKPSVGRIEVADLRREALRDISDEDVKREGLRSEDEWPRLWRYGTQHINVSDMTAAQAYLSLWKALYPKSTLDENVWVITFKYLGGQNERS